MHESATINPDRLAVAKRCSPQLRQPIEAAQDPDALLTIETAAALAGRSTATIYRLAASDPTFPRLIRRGTRCTRIRAGDLRTWLRGEAA